METMRPVAITTDRSGVPLDGELKIRESETMPGRLKVCLVVAVTNGLGAINGSGEVEIADLPEIPEVLAMGPEFRLEMN